MLLSWQLMLAALTRKMQLQSLIWNKAILRKEIEVYYILLNEVISHSIKAQASTPIESMLFSRYHSKNWTTCLDNGSVYNGISSQTRQYQNFQGSKMPPIGHCGLRCIQTAGIEAEQGNGEGGGLFLKINQLISHKNKLIITMQGQYQFAQPKSPRHNFMHGGLIQARSNQPPPAPFPPAHKLVELPRQHANNELPRHRFPTHEGQADGAGFRNDAQRPNCNISYEVGNAENFSTQVGRPGNLSFDLGGKGGNFFASRPREQQPLTFRESREEYFKGRPEVQQLLSKLPSIDLSQINKINTSRQMASNSTTENRLRSTLSTLANPADLCARRNEINSPGFPNRRLSKQKMKTEISMEINPENNMMKNSLSTNNDSAHNSNASSNSSSIMIDAKSEDTLHRIQSIKSVKMGATDSECQVAILDLAEIRHLKQRISDLEQHLFIQKQYANEKQKVIVELQEEINSLKSKHLEEMNLVGSEHKARLAQEMQALAKKHEAHVAQVLSQAHAEVGQQRRETQVKYEGLIEQIRKQFQNLLQKSGEETASLKTRLVQYSESIRVLKSKNIELQAQNKALDTKIKELETRNSQKYSPTNKPSVKQAQVQAENTAKDDSNQVNSLLERINSDSKTIQKLNQKIKECKNEIKDNHRKMEQCKQFIYDNQFALKNMCKDLKSKDRELHERRRKIDSLNELIDQQSDQMIRQAAVALSLKYIQ